MKKLILLLSVVFILLAGKKSSEQTIVKGKLVYRSCATIVVQVLDSSYYSITQNTWKDPTSKKDYEHVFAVSNQCSFPDLITVGQECMFQIIIEDPKSKDCMLCAMYDSPPQKSQLIKVIEGGK